MITTKFSVLVINLSESVNRFDLSISHFSEQITLQTVKGRIVNLYEGTSKEKIVKEKLMDATFWVVSAEDADKILTGARLAECPSKERIGIAQPDFMAFGTTRCLVAELLPPAAAVDPHNNDTRAYDVFIS
jgi:hypothetical protein